MGRQAKEGGRGRAVCGGVAQRAGKAGEAGVGGVGRYVCFVLSCSVLSGVYRQAKALSSCLSAHLSR